MSILSEETILESGKLFKENCQSRSLDTCAESSTQWFAYIKSHVTLQKVNCFTVNTFAVRHFSVSLRYFEFCSVESE